MTGSECMLGRAAVRAVAGTWLVVGMVMTTAACAGGGDDVAGPEAEILVASSFEHDLEGWVAEGIDLDDPPVRRSVQRSADRASGGSWSVRLYLENYNDKGKIWMRRWFAVQPGREYNVDISFRFATRDGGMANLWSLIAGALRSAPASGSDLPIRGHTANGADGDAGWAWLEKRYTEVVRAAAAGVIHVVTGVWGNWETPRTCCGRGPHRHQTGPVACDERALGALATRFSSQRSNRTLRVHARRSRGSPSSARAPARASSMTAS